MNIQRLRNLTTGRLHTNIEHVYKDIELLTGMDGIMTHMIPNASRAMESFLKDSVKESRFWDVKYDTSHRGDYEISPMNAKEKEVFIKKYNQLPNPLLNKNVIALASSD